MLFKPIDIASLIFFRIIFGILGFADLLGVWTYYHLYKGYFDPQKFQFKYMGFEWARPLPEPFISIIFIGLMLVALLIIIGRWYQLCSVVFFIGFGYVFLLEKALYLNHGYLFVWLSFIMIFLPCNRQWSWDVLHKPALRSDKIQAWSLWILPLMMGIVYFYGAIAKMNADWLLDANPLSSWLKSRDDMPVLGSLWARKETAYFMAWSGMLLDLCAPFLLLLRKTRAWVLGLILLFHVTNTLIFQIGIFPWLSISLSLLFFPPSWPRQAWAFAKQKIKCLHRVEGWWNIKVKLHDNRKDGQEMSDIHASIPPQYPKRAVNVALIILITFHMFMPLRHWLFPGNVAWTEEGHRFSWRMMLRSKRGYGHFSIKNLQTGEEIRIDGTNYLTDRQLEKVFTHPDMVLQFAHYLRDLWHRRGVPHVAINATIRGSLNGRKTQPFIDSKIDLAKEKWCPFKNTTWIMPLEE